MNTTVTLMPLARPDDAERQLKLDRMKRRATGLLVVATVIFVVARIFEHRYPWVAYIRATAEAAMVGGLADWFAVTALFRHPMGLPIPHTAIVASRKDRIGRTLGNFVQNNFLSREVVSRKLADMRVAERGARWLANRENAHKIARQVATGLARTAEALPDDAATRLIGESLTTRLRATRVAPILGTVLSLMTADSRHQDLLDDALQLIEQAVDDNRELIRTKVSEESPWWVPGVLDDRIYHKIITAIENLLHEVHADPDHQLRARFDDALVRFIDRLQHSPEMIAKAESLKDELLDAPLMDELSTSIWRGARTGLVKYAATEDAGTPGALERGLVAFAEAILGNPALMSEVNEFITNAVTGVIEQHRHEMGELIANTVSAWDAEVTSQRIELAVGRDLQYIRINGTLVGGLAGLLIYILAKFL